MGSGGDLTGDLDEVFGLIANDTRVDILQALWDARLEGEQWVAFSDLQERTGVDDGGRFNYHLGKLVPQFVREDDAEYALTHAGEQLIGDAVSGTYTDADTTTLGPTPVSDCPESDCDGRIEARYEQGEAVFECDTCDGRKNLVSAPPIIVESRGRERAPAVAGRYTQLVLERNNRGFCHLCDGPIEATPARDHPDHEPVWESTVDYIMECSECGEAWRTGARTALVGHPATVALLYEAGVDYRQVPYWEQTWLTEATETVVSEDPLRVAVEVTVDDEPATFTVDETHVVTDYERAGDQAQSARRSS
jgi:hypothetical protein